MKTTSRSVGVVALLIAVLEVAIFVVSEFQLDIVVGMEGFPSEIGDRGRRLPASAAVWLPWFVAGIVTWAGRRRIATALVIALAVLALPRMASTVGALWQGPADTLPPAAEVLWWSTQVAQVTVGLLALLVGIMAWRMRPPELFSRAAPPARNLYTVGAFLVWLPSIMASTQFVADPTLGSPASPRRFVEFLWNGSNWWSSVVVVLSAIVLAAVLFAIPRLSVRAAGATALVVAVPWLMAEVPNLLTAIQQRFIIVSPAAWLGIAGALCLVALAGIWLRSGRISAEDDRSTDHRQGLV